MPKVPLIGSSKYTEAVFLGNSVQARTTAGTPKSTVNKHGSISIRHSNPVYKSEKEHLELEPMSSNPG